ncbi:hypothetical protein U6X61_11500, partial [Cutibacterium acnes]
MPVKPKRLCSHPGCPDFTSDGFRTAYVKAEDVCYRRFQCDSAINKRYDHRWRERPGRSRHGSNRFGAQPSGRAGSTPGTFGAPPPPP